MTTFRIGAASDVGRVRSNNQDSKLVTDDLYAVADGMGGHLGGEVASAIAVETLRSSVSEPTIDGVISGVRMANRAIYTRSASDPDLRGMGTTLCAVARVEADGGHDQLTIVNVGDSRGYLFRGGDLTQITRDHSLVEDLRAEGRLTAEEAAVHPHRNIVTRALGIDPDVEVDHTEVDPLPGDRYVLCSDGLTNEVTLDKLGATLRRLADPQDAADELVRLANDNGGRDNITVVVVDIVEGGGSPATAAGAVAGDQRDQTAVAPAVPAAPREANTQSTVTPPPPVADATGPASGPGDAGLEPKPVSVAPAEPAVHTRRFTWRVWLFIAVVIVVLAAAVASVGWYARKSYFVGVDNGQVIIYKGRPGGVLWFDPTVAKQTGLALSDMPAQSRDDLRSGVEEPSLAAAQKYVTRQRAIGAAQQIPKDMTGGGSTNTSLPGGLFGPSGPPIPTPSIPIPEPTVSFAPPAVSPTPIP